MENESIPLDVDNLLQKCQAGQAKSNQTKPSQSSPGQAPLDIFQDEHFKRMRAICTF